MEHLLGHGGSYTDVFEIELIHITERIMAHLSPPHQLQHVPLKGYGGGGGGGKLQQGWMTTRTIVVMRS